MGGRSSIRFDRDESFYLSMPYPRLSLFFFFVGFLSLLHGCFRFIQRTRPLLVRGCRDSYLVRLAPVVSIVVTASPLLFLSVIFLRS
jgi:hypothetical protein